MNHMTFQNRNRASPSGKIRLRRIASVWVVYVAVQQCKRISVLILLLHVEAYAQKYKCVWACTFWTQQHSRVKVIAPWARDPGFILDDKNAYPSECWRGWGGTRGTSARYRVDWELCFCLKVDLRNYCSSTFHFTQSAIYLHIQLEHHSITSKWLRRWQTVSQYPRALIVVLQ